MKFDLYVPKCPCCGKHMMKKAPSGLFPCSIFDNQEAQMKDLGVVFESPMYLDDDKICAECAEQGKASFHCALCGVLKPSSKLQYSVGSPPEYLCEDCYETVSAKVWQEKVDELDDAHKWDYS